MCEKKSYYAIIPANVRYDKRLNANAKLLYGELTALSNEKGYCWATNKYFSELYEVSIETVSRWISRLRKYNYIKIEMTYNGSQIIERKIYIDVNSDEKINTPIDENVKTYQQKDQEGIDEKINTPIDENVKDNITLYNNTVNNTYNIYIDKIKKLFSIWLNSNLTVHKWNVVKKQIFQKNGKIKEKYKEILDENTIDYYIDCIHDYSEIKNNQTRYWYNHRWDFWDFIVRGYLKFGKECNPRESFRITNNKDRKNMQIISDTEKAYLLLKNTGLKK